MYTVKILNGNTNTMIHDDQSEEVLVTGEIVEEINCFDTFVFTIYPGNPGFGLLDPFKTTVTVYNNKRSRYDFKGRIFSITPSMDANGIVCKIVACQGQMSYLLDSVQPWQPERQWSGDGNTTGLQEYIDFLLANHNAQVEDYKRIYRGDVTLQTYLTSDGVYKGTHYQDTWAVLKDKLLNVFGGEMRVRETGGVLYLDYAEQLGVTRTTEIKLGHNMESIKREVDPSGIVTRLIPLGAKVKVLTTSIDENGNETTTETETEERLTIKSVNDDVVYLIDAEAEALYGRRYGTTYCDDITTAAALKAKGEAWLATNNVLSVPHTVTAADLSLINEDIDDFTLYDSYPVKNAYIDLNTTLKIVKRIINLNSPHESSFEMGKAGILISDLTNTVKTDIQSVSEALSVIKTAANNGDAEIRGSLVSSITSLVQSINNITATVEQTTESASDYAQFKQIVRNILQMDADNTTMIFQTILEQIDTVSGTESTHYNELIKFIRFVDGKIILGIQGDPFSVEISNTRVSFKQNTVEVAYLSNNNLYIGNAIIKSGGKLQLGNFAFVPRSNGSLSLLKVGEVV